MSFLLRDSTQVLLERSLVQPDPPSGLVVSLDFIKVYLRLPLDLTDEDTFLTAAINSIESLVDQSFSTHIRPIQYETTLHCFPLTHRDAYHTYSALHFNVQPALLPPEIVYTNKNNEQVTLDDVRLIRSCQRTITVVTDADLLNKQLANIAEPISLTVSIGYESIPDSAKIAIAQAVAYQYQNRELFMQNRAGNEIFQLLLNPIALQLQASAY